MRKRPRKFFKASLWSLRFCAAPAAAAAAAMMFITLASATADPAALLEEAIARWARLARRAPSSSRLARRATCTLKTQTGVNQTPGQIEHPEPHTRSNTPDQIDHPETRTTSEILGTEALQHYALQSIN